MRSPPRRRTTHADRFLEQEMADLFEGVTGDKHFESHDDMSGTTHRVRLRLDADGALRFYRWVDGAWASQGTLTLTP